MNWVVAVRPVVSVYREPCDRAPLTSQLLLGETGRLDGRKGEWLAIVTEDAVSGWVHRGSIQELDEAAIEVWRRDRGWSSGAVLQSEVGRWWLPLRARPRLVADQAILPGGGAAARVLSGMVRPRSRAESEALLLPPEEWAVSRFANTPWLNGGVTPGGVDSGGLVQTTWLARGILLPRHPAEQIGVGSAVPQESMRPGDLAFFLNLKGDSITHVGIISADSTLIHATLEDGGVVAQSWLPGHPAHRLMERLAGVRRIADPLPPAGVWQ